MSELRKANFDACFFVTLTVVDWIDVFSRQEYVQLLISSLKFCQQYKGLEIFSYVVMTNHLHMIVRQQEGKLNDVLADFKSYTAKVILAAIKDNPKESRKDWLLHMFRFNAHLKHQYQRYHFWQPTNHAITITSPAMQLQKVIYVHQNPVRAGYVAEAEHWVYSSAYAFSPLKVMDI
ncbi:MAG: transposase [Bacteroidetes bacterium]|nr:transposase [Bacteroidota bacterium]